MTHPAGAEHVLITGADGYLGRALCTALRADPRWHGARLTLTDRQLGSSDGIVGDLAEPGVQERCFQEPVTHCFHLAGIVSGAAEADFELGLQVNLQATLALLERCRRQQQGGGPMVRLVYASSIAVFGVPLPASIDDDTPATPALSYGAHKRVVELLIDDYSRRGFLDGRALRLPGVVVRPPMPNGALSGFNSDLIREPLAGRNYRCPVGPQATMWLSSLPRVIDGLRASADWPQEALGAVRTVNLPALAVSVAQVVQAIARRDPAAARRIDFESAPAPALVAQFGNWPLQCRFDRARALMLNPDPDLDCLIGEGLRSMAVSG